MQEKKCKNCRYFNPCLNSTTDIGPCMNSLVEDLVVSDDSQVYFHGNFGCILWEPNEMEWCSCGNPSGKTAISSPIDEVETCKDCGKPIK